MGKTTPGREGYQHGKGTKVDCTSFKWTSRLSAARHVYAQGTVRHLLVALTCLSKVGLRVPAAACNTELFRTVCVHFRHVDLAQHQLPNETVACCEDQLKQVQCEESRKSCMAIMWKVPIQTLVPAQCSVPL